jgi:predicted ATPase
LPTGDRHEVNNNESTNHERFYIVTGGPGSGKTSLLEALRSRGYACSVEAGRGIIQDQVSIAGRALPWADRALFAELMLSWEMRNYHIAQEIAGPVFFDRGMTDVLGYLRLIGIPAPVHIQNAAREFRYNQTVFITPPWPEIFSHDRERKQDFDEAVRTYESLSATYEALDYKLVEIPRMPVEQRTSFILDHLGISTGKR